MDDPFPSKPNRHLPTDRAASARRWLFASLGCVFVAVGIVGVVVPLLPTTPFMLLAAACFARGSRRLYAWLLGTRLFGPTITAWYETHTIPCGAKALAIALIIILLGSTIVLFVSNAVVRVALALIGLGVIVYLLRIPTRPPPHPRRASPDQTAGERLTTDHGTSAPASSASVGTP